MSFQAMTWATAQTCGSASAKLVLLMLANHANGHTGQCNPRHKTLAAECEMRVETLKDHLKRLADAGLIEIIPQFSEGVQLPNHYQLMLHGGGGEFHPGGGGEKRTGGGGEFHPPNNQEVNQENNHTPQTPKGATPCEAEASKPKAVQIKTWLEAIAAEGQDAVPEGDPIFEFASGAGIPDEFLSLAWDVFKDRAIKAGKRQKDWRATFRNYVRGNYLKLWYVDAEGSHRLTTVGEQERRALQGMAHA